jgi:hypothetical protein
MIVKSDLFGVPSTPNWMDIGAMKPRYRALATPALCHWVVLVGLVFVLMGLFGCGGTAQTVHQDESLRVSLEADPAVSTGRSPAHDHPAKFQSAQMQILLQGVEVERSPGFLKSIILGPKRDPAFTAEEIAALAPRLTETLRQATPNERVSFAMTSAPTSNTREITSGKAWVQGNEFHLVLDRYRMPEGGRPTAIPGPYQSSFSRGTLAQQTVAADFTVLFSPSRYMIVREPSLKAQMLANPETEVAVNYPKLFSDASKGPIVTAERAEERADRSNRAGASTPDSVRLAPPEDASGSQAVVQTLTDRVKALEGQVNELVGIVKSLSHSLEESRKELAAKDQQIQNLLNAPGTSDKSKPPRKGK